MSGEPPQSVTWCLDSCSAKGKQEEKNDDEKTIISNLNLKENKRYVLFFLCGLSVKGKESVGGGGATRPSLKPTDSERLDGFLLYMCNRQ